MELNFWTLVGAIVVALVLINLAPLLVWLAVIVGAFLVYLIRKAIEGLGWLVTRPFVAIGWAYGQVEHYFWLKTDAGKKWQKEQERKAKAEAAERAQREKEFAERLKKLGNPFEGNRGSK